LTAARAKRVCFQQRLKQASYPTRRSAVISVRPRTSFRLHPPSDVSNPLLRADAPPGRAAVARAQRSKKRRPDHPCSPPTNSADVINLWLQDRGIGPLPNTAPSNQVSAKHRLSDVIDRLTLCRLISENTTVVSNSYPHASQDHKLPTHRSLTYLESLTAIEAAWQLGQRWCAFPLTRFTSNCYKDIHRTCKRPRASSRLPRSRQRCHACRTKPTTDQSIRSILFSLWL
jgi:hypothetical protein